MMPRKKTKRKTSRESSSKRRKSGFNDPFSLGIEPLEIEFPKLEMPSLELPSMERKRIDPNKLSKPQLIALLSKELSVTEVYRALIFVKKHSLAENFRIEAERINQKYDRKIAEIEGRLEEFDLQHKILHQIIDEILSYLKAIYKENFNTHNEFQNHLKSFLIWLSEVIERQLSKLPISGINVKKEFQVSEKDRLDLLVRIGNWRIGIEVKYDLSNQGEAKRLLGQIDTYLPYCDAFILASYKEIPSWLVNQIKVKEQEKGKMIKILAPNKVI